jgi:hypothetical protein
MKKKVVPEPFELPERVYMVDGFTFKFKSEEAAKAFRRGLATKRQHADIFVTQPLEWGKL